MTDKIRVSGAALFGLGGLGCSFPTRGDSTSPCGNRPSPIGEGPPPIRDGQKYWGRSVADWRCWMPDQGHPYPMTWHNLLEPHARPVDARGCYPPLAEMLSDMRAPPTINPSDFSLAGHAHLGYCPMLAQPATSNRRRTRSTPSTLAEGQPEAPLQSNGVVFTLGKKVPLQRYVWGLSTLCLTVEPPRALSAWPPLTIAASLLGLVKGRF